MNILIVAFYDDNFGDMLIRTCFSQLLKTALENLGVSGYSIGFMPLKSPDGAELEKADLIIFPGGGLFGLSYLDFADYVERVLDSADSRGVPVLFSSLGVNNMDATGENEQRLSDMLKRRCIRAVSVRENPALFRHYSEGAAYEICDVCDPAVWAGFAYSGEAAAARAKKAGGKPVVGINVVRGGLFKSNGYKWALKDEEDYLYRLCRAVEARGADYRFFSNGSTLDCNVIRHLAEKYDIPAEKLILTDTSRELVEAIAGFDAVFAIRMHASIVSYALGVPSVNLVWNSKIPEFYSKIGFPERAVPLGELTDEYLTDAAKELLSGENYAPDPRLLMSLYHYLYRALGDVFAPPAAKEEYGFEEVCARLSEMRVEVSEDDTDLRIKVRKGELRYASLFSSDLARKAEMRSLKAELKTVGAEAGALKAEKKKLGDDRKKLAEEKKKLAAKLEKTEAQRVQLQKQLDRINSMFPVRVYRKLKRIFR